MKKTLFILSLIGIGILSHAQTWISKPNYPSSGRNRARAFSMPSLNSVIVVGGYDGSYKHDTYQYDTAFPGTWTNLPAATFPGSSTVMVAFTIGDTGYVGTGADGGSSFSNSFYKFDPATKTWIQRASLPGAVRGYAFGFATGGKGYIGGGCTNSGPGFSDFYQFDPTINQWKKVTDYPGGGGSLGATAFNIGDTGYVGTGESLDASSNVVAYKDFWEYDPSHDKWTQRADFPGGTRCEAMGYGTCGAGYMGCGYTASNTGFHNDFYRFDPAENKWTQIANFAFGQDAYGVACSLGQSGYVGLGFSGTTDYKELYEYHDTPLAAFTTTVGSASPVICAGSSLSYTDTSNFAPIQWKWSFPGGTPDTSNLQNPVIVYNTPGVYTVGLTALNACDNGVVKFTNYVTVTAAPTLTLTPATPSVCNGQNVTLTAGGATTYTWSNGATASSINVSPVADSTYKVTGMGGGCTSVDSVKVLVVAVPVPTISSAQSVCMNNSVPLLAGGGSTYTWAPAVGLSSAAISDPLATPTNTTTYTVTIANGTCMATENVLVTVNLLPISSVSATASIAIGQSTNLAVTSGSTSDTYLWSPAASLSCNTCANPVATPAVSTLYYVTVINASSCEAKDSVLVNVNESCGAIYMPTAFSPNGDGTNDVIKVMGNCIKDMELVIYDRWGNTVFEATNPSSVWDGTFKGKPMNTGTYVFSLTTTDTDNNIISKRGNLTLLR